MRPPVEPPPLLCETVHVVFRHRGKMTLFFLAVLVGTALLTFLGPRSYRSEAKLFVRLGRENTTLDPTATLGQSSHVAVPEHRENEINSVIEILKSRVLLEKVVDTLGPAVVTGLEPPATSPAAATAPLPGSPEALERFAAVRKLGRMLDIEAVRKSNIVHISCDSPSPELSQLVVARLTEFYLEEHLRLYRTPGAHRFLAEQTERLRAQLARAETALQHLQNETGLFAPEGQRQLVVARVGRLQDELLQADAALAAAETEATLLRERVASLPKTQVTSTTLGLPNVAADTMRSQLYALELREQELLAKHPEEHPEVRLVRRQTAAAKTLLKQEEGAREQVSTGPNRLHEEAQLALLKLEPTLASLRAKSGLLRRQLDDQRDELKGLSESQFRLARLQRDLQLHEAQYRKYADNLEQSRIDQALETEKISNISIVQPATYDPKAVKPSRALNFGLGLALAVLGAIGLALAAEYLKPSVKTPNPDLEIEERLGLPVLASPPQLTPRELALDGSARESR